MITVSRSLALVAVLCLYSLPASLAGSAASDTSGRTEWGKLHFTPLPAIPHPSRFDCDGNFIPDSLDIAGGFAVDLNHNRIPDSCEPDTMLLWSVASQRWRDQDSVFFSSAYLRGQSVLLRYTVPKQAKVRLEIRSASGDLVRLLDDGNRARGAYEEHWDRRNEEGRLVPAGEYEVQLTVGSTKRSTRVRWAAWP